MHGRSDTAGRSDTRTHERTHGRTDEGTHGRKYGSRDERTQRRMVEWQMDARTDAHRRTFARMDGKTVPHWTYWWHWTPDSVSVFRSFAVFVSSPLDEFSVMVELTISQPLLIYCSSWNLNDRTIIAHTSTTLTELFISIFRFMIFFGGIAPNVIIFEHAHWVIAYINLHSE